MSAEPAVEAVERYLETLRRALGGLPAAERDEIVLEMRTHLLERIEDAADPGTVDAVLAAVGDPKELAAQYRTQTMLRRAAASRSPILLLRTTLRWATTGVAGIFAFLLAVAGYGTALVFYLSALMKPFFPARIGLWLGPGSALTFGYWNGGLPAEAFGTALGSPGFCVLCKVGPSAEPLRELLGVWLIPIGIVSGLAFGLATTRGVRWFIARFGLRGGRASPWSAGPRRSR